MVVATERASSAAVYESGTRKRRGTMVMKWLKRFDVLLHGLEIRNQLSYVPIPAERAWDWRWKRMEDQTARGHRRHE